MKAYELNKATKDLDELQKASTLKVMDTQREDTLQKILDKMDTRFDKPQNKLDELGNNIGNKLDTIQNLLWVSLIATIILVVLVLSDLLSSNNLILK